MYNDQNKLIARRLVEEGFNTHSLKLVDELFAADAKIHDPQQPSVGRGPDGVRQSMQGYLTAFPDSKITIEREIAEGELVVLQVRAIGTHTGALAGISATNKKTDVIGVITSKFKDGKIVEQWSLFDQLGLLQQLGVVERQTATKERELVGAR